MNILFIEKQLKEENKDSARGSSSQNLSELEFKSPSMDYTEVEKMKKQIKELKKTHETKVIQKSLVEKSKQAVSLLEFIIA